MDTFRVRHFSVRQEGALLESFQNGGDRIGVASLKLSFLALALNISSNNFSPNKELFHYIFEDGKAVMLEVPLVVSSVT